MPKLLSADSLNILVSRKAIMVARTTGRMRPRSAILVDAHLPEDIAIPSERFTELFAAVLAQTQCTGLPVRIVLADSLVRMFMVTPPHNPTRLEDCRAAAAMRFQALYDEPAAGWELRGDWDVQHAFLACAMPSPLLDSLHHACRKRALKLVAVTPQFVFAVNAGRTLLVPNAWLGVMHDGRLSLGAVHDKRLHAVRAIDMAADAWGDDAWLADLVQREALRLGLPVPSELQLCRKFFENWAAPAQVPLDRIPCGIIQARATAAPPLKAALAEAEGR